MTNEYDFGMIGLGTMGRNLLLNIADHGFAAIGFDKDADKTSQLEAAATPGTKVKGVNELTEMLGALKAPRKIMLLVPAGKPVDDVIASLIPHLAKGDIIIDGGNSFFADTLRRVEEVKKHDIHFMGMGVSGGEKGARRGPSIMPGGDVEAWSAVKPILEAVAAKVGENEPCVAYMGNGAAGHYVKMVHNGIEYGIMQIITEIYGFLKNSAGLSNDELQQAFARWNEGDLQSFLVEITADIFKKEDALTPGRLVDFILDKAGSKGTGKWTSQEAMNLGVPIPTIDMAVAMRSISALKTERVTAAALYKPKVKSFEAQKEKAVQLAEEALYTGMLVCYAQGLAMIQAASDEYKMNIPLYDVVRIWRGGCIIRSKQLVFFAEAYRKTGQLPNILLNRKIATVVKKKQVGLRKLVVMAAQAKVPAGALGTVLAYLDAYSSENLPINLLQAQRDYFGAHTYQRIDKEGSFHTEW